MIIAFSTSSPWSSVAIIEGDEVQWHGTEHAPRRASGACLALLEAGLLAVSRELEEATLFAADLGPGSFTGVRVGVVLAKTFAWTHRVQCVGADAFDLVSSHQTVALPSRKAEVFVRVPGATPFRTSDVPADAIGYGFEGGENPPSAAGFAKIWRSLVPVSPEALVPAYLIEPSISIPKVKFPSGPVAGA